MTQAQAETREESIRRRGASEHIAHAQQHCFDPKLLCGGCGKHWDDQREDPTTCEDPLPKMRNQLGRPKK